MSCRLGLAIGESFAEISGYHPPLSQPIYSARWYLAKKSLADGIKEALKACPPGGGTLRVASNSVERILSRDQGRAPAVLVTSGFESWLTLRQPILSPPFATKSYRRKLVIEDDSVFGVSERIRQNGEVEAALNNDDLEFLASKLELLKVRDIALIFLHASVNPVHELQAAEFLTKKGFRVYMSHQLKTSNLEERWRQTIECAFTESALKDEKEQIENAVKEAGPWTLECWGPNGVMPWSEYSAMKIRHGLDRALSSALKKGEQRLHCGLDYIRLLDTAAEDLGQTPLNKISPTALIEHGLWPFPHISRNSSGFEPGPMLFGKSHQLAVLDILYVRERLQLVEGLSNLLSEKSRSRILETLFTLAKTPGASPKKRPPDAAEIAANLEAAFSEEIAVLLASSDHVKKSVILSGALAESLKPVIGSRRHDLDFNFTPQNAFFESYASAAPEAT